MKKRNAIAIAAATSVLVAGLAGAGDLTWSTGTGVIGTANIADGAVTNAKLASSYSGVGACAASRFASTLVVNAAPTCTQVGFADLSGSAAVGQGGTGLTSYTIGDILYASAATTIAGLADAAAGKWLRSAGAGVAPAWSTPTLPNSAASGVILRGDGTNWVASTPAYPNAATSGAHLVGDGVNIVLSTPTWPNTAPASGRYPKGDGTNFVLSTGSASGTGACPGGQFASTLNADAAPTCTTPAGATAGDFIGTQTLTSGTTYTPTAGTNTVTLVLIGGGGGGGGVTTGSGVASGAGGGGGGSCIKTFGSVSGTYAYVIGAAGSVTSGGAGGAGGNTTFTNGGTTYTAFGGGGGSAASPRTTVYINPGSAGGAVSTNCDVNGAGTAGGYGTIFGDSTTAGGGNGAGSIFGGGGRGRANVADGSGAGFNSAGFGSGGGGAAASNGTAFAGGTATAGLIIVYEYK